MVKQNKIKVDNNSIENLKMEVSLLKDAYFQLKRTERKLQESEKKYKDFLDGANDFIQSVDSEGKFIFVNKLWKEKLGYSIEEVNSMNFLDILHKDHISNSTQIFKELKQGDLFREVETIFVAKNGEEIFVEGNISSNFVKDKFISTFGIFRDITTRKQAEKKLKELDATKNMFIKIVSHQMRTPLSEIRWTLEILLKGSLGELKPEQENILRDIYNSDKKLIDRIDDLAITLNIEENKIDLELQKSDVNSLINSILIEYEPDVKLKKINILFDKQDLGVKLNIDPVIFKKAVSKLLDNAIKYSDEGGKISLVTEIKDNNFNLTVSDDGMGVPQDDQDNIFTKFYRASNAFTKVPDASGLGLFIAKSLIEAHGGKIWFNSREGKGSDFYIMLPISKEKD